MSPARAEAACPLTVSGLPCSRSDRQLRGADEARGRAAEPRRSAAGEGRAEEEGNGARGAGAGTPPSPRANAWRRCVVAMPDLEEKHSQAN